MKRILLITICLSFLFLCAPIVNAQPYKIVDEAGLLTESEKTFLNSCAEEITQTYNMDVVIVTVDSLGYKTSEAFADDYFDENGYGCGESSNGILLLLAMEDRDWAISTSGEAIYAVTDYGIENLFSEIAPYLADNNYNLAFLTYLEALTTYFDAYLEGQIIDGNIYDYTGPGSFEIGTQEEIVYAPAVPESFGSRLLRSFSISLIFGAIVSGVNLLVLRRSMNTIQKASGAKDYVVPGSFRMKIQRDIFLYSHETRTRIETSSGSSSSHGGGGSSVHHSASGHSHGGGHGKF